MALIGIDLGTSFLKGAILNTETLRPEHVEREPFPDPLPGLPPVFREYDVRAILAAVRALIERLAPRATPCEGILFSTQMHGLILTDLEGREQSNLLTWLDQRVTLPHPSGEGSYFDVLVSRLTAEQLRELDGTELRPGLPAGSLFWMAENGKLPNGNGPSGKLMPVALGDFVAAQLAGVRPVTEVSNAQAHGAMNILTSAWHQGVIERLGLAELVWPEIVPQGSVVGHLELGGRQVPLFTPVGDFQAAAAGALLEPDELWLNISTGSQVSLPRQEPELGSFQTRPFFDCHYLITVTTIPAGRALSSLVKLLSELALAEGHALADPWSYISRAAAAAPDPAMQANIAFFAGAVGDRGSLTNLREEELTVGHLFRAAFHNMADNYRECAGRLTPSPSWRRLVFSGGLAQKMELLRQLICERFEVPYRYCPVAEDTMLGLLVLGLAFTGKAGSVSEASRRVRDSF
ncbi:MAG TPA: FGGY family carbohydrate kinase [Pirellulales bacterium]